MKSWGYRAERWAEEFLLAHLDEKQRGDLAESGDFTVVGSLGGTYKITRLSVVRIAVPWWRPVFSRFQMYCIRVDDFVPRGDWMLAVMLLLKTNEWRFLKIARVVGW